MAAPLFLPNVDTDVIMPKQFLKRIDREGLADGVFHDVRRTEDGALREDFPLNLNRYADAKILIAGRNFGCGSSREHAVWGLLQTGIRVVIAPSFAGIFFGNCEKNGLLAIKMDEPQVADLAELAKTAEMPVFTIDLESCEIGTPGGAMVPFFIEPIRRQNLLEGRDHIELTLESAAKIRAFQTKHLAAAPWLAAER